ncbi:MAG TPA: replication-associated recombination protein A [Candidatus Goldiibacteriota bacterium]|jgi:putative ATPase|nr:replication-associated recombination protein A [Candidatus Goldiibacteriota bacterium]HRQ44569.1 replication-associated recombination protein A [Candidatus Goldiibacteriota bacterium]
MQEDLFSAGTPEKDKYRPLAYRMRPLSLDEFSGQEQAVGKKGYLRGFLEKGSIPSIIFWGPPGTGKTTLAMIIAKHINAEFIPLSAVNSGTKEVKEVLEKARLNHSKGKKTIMFIDEIHRFNKSQQDGFLPHVENGTIILIGATTENPSFEVNSALLSRARVITLKPLEEADIRQIVLRAVNDKERGLGKRKIGVHDDAFKVFDLLSNGDARTALNILEMIDNMKTEESYEITVDDIKEVTEKNTHFYDKGGEEHYNIISALHKSMRDSDPDAAAYWAARMMESGDAPLYVARRIIRFASEDIGNADTNALVVALAAKESYDFLGSPEGELAIIQSAVYMATAPKSNAVYMAHNLVKEDLKNFRDDPVPMHIRNAPTKLMKELGYGKGYKYAHDYEGHYVKQDHLPDRLKGRKYYEPTDNGAEAEIKERMKKWQSGS